MPGLFILIFIMASFTSMVFVFFKDNGGLGVRLLVVYSSQDFILYLCLRGVVVCNSAPPLGTHRVLQGTAFNRENL